DKFLSQNNEEVFFNDRKLSFEVSQKKSRDGGGKFGGNRSERFGGGGYKGKSEGGYGGGRSGGYKGNGGGGYKGKSEGGYGGRKRAEGGNFSKPKYSEKSSSSKYSY
ncbi:MAG TPA: hypothetical protein VGF30_14045, partial [Bacteroidia bacterium]